MQSVHTFSNYLTSSKCCISCDIECMHVKGIYLSKALTCMNFFPVITKMLFIKGTDTFGHIVV